jgi:hypothetical protein
MHYPIQIAIVLMLLVAVAAVTMAKPENNAFWVDGMLFRTVGTPTSLSDRGPKDGIFVFNGLNGQTPVAEAKPGDKDYNGGRWQVYILSFTEAGRVAHDGDGDGLVDFQLASWEMVNDHIGLGHLEMAGMGPSFVCPVIK